MIKTPRLELLPATPQTLRSELNRHDALSIALNAHIPSTWPPEGVRDVLEFFAQDLEKRPDANGWVVYYWILRADADAEEKPAGRTLVGSGGFKGSPDAHGAVEIGYGTLPLFWNHGYASEAARGLVNYAFTQPNITQVWAEALPENGASVRVLQNSGFTKAGAGSEPGTERFECFKP